MGYLYLSGDSMYFGNDHFAAETENCEVHRKATAVLFPYVETNLTDRDSQCSAAKLCICRKYLYSETD